MIEFTKTSVEIFGFSVRYYGILIALGVLSGIITAQRREKRYSLPKDTVIDLALWVIPAAIICARLYYVVFRLDMFWASPLSILDIRSGGMAIYGGILGGVLAGFVYTRVKHAPFLTLADLAAPSIAIGQAIGRWGNFINQEAYGIAVENPAFQFFPVSVFIERQSGWFAATFFYESAWCFLIFLTLLLLERKNAFRFPGAAAAYYACLYAVERAAVEGLRTDSLYFGPVRVSQALSVLVLVILALALAFRHRHAKNRRAAAAVFVASSLVCLLSALFSGLQPFSALLIPSLILSGAGCLYLLFASQQ